MEQCAVFESFVRLEILFCPACSVTAGRFKSGYIYNARVNQREEHVLKDLRTGI
jgi:hypothetical protein